MNPISIEGVWRLELDRADAGIGERWFARELQDRVELPGTLAAQGIGDRVTAETAWTGTIFGPDPSDTDAAGHVRMKCWLQPERVYVGAAWFQRDVEIPAEWADRRVTLELERPHWFTRVWIDEREVGTGESLSTPHLFELGQVAPGQHRLTLRIDNRLHIAVGENAHSVSDHTQGNWNGVVGRIELRATPRVWIDELVVFPDVATRSVNVKGAIGGDAFLCEGGLISLEVTIDPGWGALSLTRPGRHGDKPLDPLGALSLSKRPPHLRTKAPIFNGAFESTISLGPDAALWDEFTPVTHSLVVSVPGGDSRSASFGLREIRVEGRQLLINGRPLFLRGTVDSCVFPRTGHPPTDVESWRTVLRTIIAHGLNHVRFHSWCPPEAAFVAGDELGVYFQVEAPTWPNIWAVLAGKSPGGIGDGAPVDAWTFAESERIVRAYGNHPCFVMMAAGNEPGGPNHREYLAGWVTHMKAFDSRRLYTGASGWPEMEENEFAVIPEPRIHQWLDNLNCRLNATPPATVADYRASVQRRTMPVVSHEIGQWSSFPPVDAVAKYTGHLKPRNFEVFAESLAAHGMADRVRVFCEASGRLQAICYKEEIESQLRTPGLGGFQLLALQDFPGQGTAPVGVLDPFLASKAYASTESFRRFCGPTVPLARLARRVFTVGETMEVGIEIAHFGSCALEAATADWRLEDSRGAAVRSGHLEPVAVSLGAGQPLGSVPVTLDDLPAPARYRLVIRIEEASVENDWDVWVYPAQAPVEPDGVLVTNSVEAAVDALAGGRRVLFTAEPKRAHGEPALGFTPIFWNTWCTGGQEPHTLGIACEPDHPAFADFPTEHHSNWHWWHVVARAGAFALDGLPAELRPIVAVIDDWYSNRKLALVFEARAGEGRLLVCGADLAGESAANPVARQLRASLVRYAASERFAPTVELSRAQIAALVKD